jgi:hypothetical protein
MSSELSGSCFNRNVSLSMNVHVSGKCVYEDTFPRTTVQWQGKCDMDCLLSEHLLKIK